MKPKIIIITFILLNIIVLSISVIQRVERLKEYNEEKTVNNLDELGLLTEVDIIALEEELDHRIENLYEEMEKEAKENESIFDKFMQSEYIYIIVAMIFFFSFIFRWWKDFEYEAKRNKLVILSSIKKIVVALEPYMKYLLILLISIVELDILFDTICPNNRMFILLELDTVVNFNYELNNVFNILIIILSIISVFGITTNKIYGIKTSILLFIFIIATLCLDVIIYDMSIISIIPLFYILITIPIIVHIYIILKFSNKRTNTM